MLGLPETLLVAALVLVLVASLPAVRKPGVLVGSGAYALALAAGVLLVSYLVRGSSAPRTRASSIRKYGAQALSRAREKNVLLIDGGSYAARAVDERVLTRELARLGYSVRAVQLSVGAGNHFERLRMYEEIASSLAPELPDGQRWIFLAEVHYGYDVAPVAQFGENQDTDRTYHYMTPHNAYDAALALHSAGTKPVDFEHPYWSLARHSLVNLFNAGLDARVVPWRSIKAQSGFVKGDSMRRFKGLGSLQQELRTPGEPVAVPPWMFDIREARVRGVLGPYLKDWVYFGVPSMLPIQLRYVRSFCASTKEKCIAPSDEKLIESLNEASLWYNQGHLSTEGSVIYSRWLAGELHRRGILH